MIVSIEDTGKTRTSFWRTLQLTDIRLRMVEYCKEFIADYWCDKGHVVHCLKVKFESELENGTTIIITNGISYIVSDELSSHRSI